MGCNYSEAHEPNQAKAETLIINSNAKHTHAL